MKNYKQDGRVLTIPAPSDVLSGDVVLLGDLIGVAVIDALTGEDCSFQIAGVISDAPKTAAQVWEPGDLLAFDGTSFTNVTTGELACGHAAVGAASADTTGDVLLGVRGVPMGA